MMDNLHTSRSLRYILALSVSFVVSGCAGTTDFSGFSRGYNDSASESNDEQLLLNIMRSSHYSPLQFTSLQTATGSQSLTGGLSFSVAPGGRSGGATAGGQLSTTLATAIVDTKEFYNGMTRSIPLQIVNTFFQDSPSNAVLFNLFFDRILISTQKPECLGKNEHLSRCEKAFRNNPRDARDFALYQVVMQYLFQLGLTTESIRIDGPKKKDTKGEKSETTGKDEDKDLKPDDVHLCFKPQNDKAVRSVLDQSRSLCTSSLTRHMTLEEAQKFENIEIILSKELVKELKEVINSDTKHKCIEESENSSHVSALDDQNDCKEKLIADISEFADKKVKILLPTRSTIHVISFLGAVASAQLNHEKSYRSLISTSSDTRSFNLCQTDDDPCSPLLLVKEGTSPGAITTNYRGHIYSVPDDINAYSFYVLGVVRQLIALNTSSKDLPTPAVLTAVP